MAVNLALSINDAILLDCDVEDPNCHIFFKEPMVKVKDVGILVPSFDLNKCTLCGKCAEFCQYNAISIVGKKLLFFEKLCHGCGGCKIICPDDAITENNHPIGVIEKCGRQNPLLYHGLLNVAEPLGLPIIRELKEIPDSDAHATVILDAPPGTACPAVETVRDTSFCILVTEPTPFGLHDLKLAIDVVKDLHVPFGVVVNRYGIGDERVEQHCKNEDVSFLVKIPNDLRITKLYSQGIPIVEGLSEYKTVFVEMYDKIQGVM